MKSTVLGGVVPALIGAALAFLAIFVLVSSQTGAPSSNPANHPAIVYGS